MIPRKTLYRLTFLVAAFASLILAGCDDGPKPMQWPGLTTTYTPTQAQANNTPATTPTQVSGPMQIGPDGTYQMTPTETGKVIETSDADKIWHGVRKTENYLSELFISWYVVLIILFGNALAVVVATGFKFRRLEKPVEGVLAILFGLLAIYLAEANDGYHLMVLALVCNMLFGVVMLIWGIATENESGKWGVVAFFALPMVAFIAASVAQWVRLHPILTALILVAVCAAGLGAIANVVSGKKAET